MAKLLHLGQSAARPCPIHPASRHQRNPLLVGAARELDATDVETYRGRRYCRVHGGYVLGDVPTGR